MIAPRPLVLVGCGNMGSALLRGFLGAPGTDLSVHIVAPHQYKARPFLTDDRVSWYESPDHLPPLTAGAIYIFAVKPQILSDVLPLYAHRITDQDLCISVAAGKTVSFFESFLGSRAPCVRAFPNTPTAIGRGIFLCYTKNSAVQKTVTTLLQPLGSVHWFADEDMLHGAASLAASGPAFVFQFAESLAAAGVSVGGLSPELSEALVAELLIGTAAYLESSGKSPAYLRAQVTSPQGMTAAGIQVLQKNGALESLLTDMLNKTMARSRELVP